MLKRAAKPMVGNVVMIGDTAGSGSPVGALGGSLSLAAYPEALERLVTHPSFNKPNELNVLQKAYEKDITDIVSIRHGKSTAIMRSLNFYNADTALTQLRHTYPQLHADAETRKTQHNSINGSSEQLKPLGFVTEWS